MSYTLRGMPSDSTYQTRTLRGEAYCCSVGRREKIPFIVYVYSLIPYKPTVRKDGSNTSGDLDTSAPDDAVLLPPCGSQRGLIN